METRIAIKQKKYLFKELAQEKQKAILEKLDFIIKYKSFQKKWDDLYTRRFYDVWIFNLNKTKRTLPRWRKYLYFEIHKRIDKYRKVLGLPILNNSK